MYSNINRSRMCQGTLGPNEPNRPLARGYAWHTPNTFKVIAKVGYFYRLELPLIIRIFNIFYIKLLILIITNPLSS